MKKIYSIIIFLLLLVQTSWAQTYGNEWIDYDRPHYNFKVTQNTIHRIGYQTLVNAGIPVASIPSNQFQIFGKEREIALRIVDGGDNNIGPGDYIEFYAEKNDGWLDSLLYDDPNTIGNPAYSLYNDTLNYFLTWKQGNHLRFVEENDVNFNIYTPAPFVIQKSRINYNNQYYGGFSVLNAYSSFFSPGEGWGGNNFNGANSFTLNINFPTPSVYNGSNAPDALFHAKSNANSNAAYSGQGNHHLRWEIGSSNTLLYDEIFIGYRQTIVNETFSTNLLSNNTTNVAFKIIGDQGAATDFQSINYIEITYPRSLVFNNNINADFLVSNNSSQAKNRLDISGANFNNPICMVFGGTPRIIPLVDNNGTFQGLIPNANNTNQQRVIIHSANEIQNVDVLSPVNGNGMFTNINNLDFEKSLLMVTHNALISAANNYKNYRSSSAGGAHNTHLFDVQELYYQFGGGIDKHVMGIRRISQFAYNETSEKPVGLLLLGKAIREANEPNTSTGAGTRKNANSYSNSLVPSYGYPSSDVCITSRFNSNDNSWAPYIPTGRIAARNNQQLNAYLEKLQIYEAAQNQNSVYNKPNKEWQKQILHFGGGSNANEHSLFQNYLNNMKTTIEGAEFGGNVTSYFKDNSNPFNPVLTSEVTEKLQEGISLMTFFGHASATGFDQNVDDPENWGNTGKYPILLGNSCYTGDIFQPIGESASERFVLIPNLGTVGFLSSTKLGFSSFLNLFSSELYRQMSPKNYGLPLAKQVQNTIKEIEGNSVNFILETTVQQMTLHGDPLMKLNWHTLPEIDLTTQDVFFEPTNFDLTTDSLTVGIVLTNLGKSIQDTFSLDLKRSFPNANQDSLYQMQIFGLDYKDTFYFKLPVQQEIGIGMNNFEISADIPSFVDEQYDEINNNQITTSLFIDVDGIMPVLPYNYAVVPNDSVVIKASTINPIADFNTYRFELDTTDLFNSPQHRYAQVSGFGGVKEVFPNDWKFVSNNSNAPLTLTDSMCYFWRVAVDSSVYNWREHSFQYIKGKEGWGQEHFFQFKNGGFNGIEYDRTVRRRNFEPISRIIEAQVHDNAGNAVTYTETLWKLNGEIAEYNMCGTSPSIHVAVVDPTSMEPWETAYQGQNPQNSFGQANPCRPRPEKYFVFRQNSTAQLAALDNMIKNEVPNGHHLLIFTARFAQYNNWQNLYPDLFQTMQTLGAQNMSSSSPDRAFIFFVTKGDLNSAQTVHAQQNGEFITLAATVEGAENFGKERSTIIGPALNWETIYWKQTGLEQPNNDKTTLSIRALNANKNLSFIIDTTFTANDSILNLNNLVDANLYPYLQLEATYKDTVDLTPAQVNRWHVLYETLPEAAIDGSSQFTWLPELQNEQLQEGQDVQFAVDVKNISHLNMDSLLVNYWIVKQNQQIVPVSYPRTDSLRVGQTLRDTIEFSTLGLAGNNILWMEVNPYINGTLKDQPELAHFNNVLQLPFNVGEDDLNPILDVTFDGLHILNGDIVSPKAEVVITLKDDNPFLVMENDADTSLFGIYLTTPNNEQRRIPFINSDGLQIMQWIPADGNNLKFKIIFPAEFTEEGTYELLVQGADKSGNLSGDLEYKVKFDVILGSSITHMMNYPNPFSTQTRFVFTLTGSEIPDEIIIQIMTVTGRVVREITQDELGPIRIGRNVTTYAWNGRDEFGDQLANGVYLYKVNARINGESIEHRNSGADQHFKRNWGKMYLMR